jgi:large subunit ribosomal protein L23
MKKKPKKVRYQLGYTSAWKKAIITLKPESKTIEFFDGMM